MELNTCQKKRLDIDPIPPEIFKLVCFWQKQNCQILFRPKKILGDLNRPFTSPDRILNCNSMDLAKTQFNLFFGE